MSQEDRPFRPSPFLDPGSCSSSDSLAVLQLKRDHLIATKLSDHDENHEGYDEGRVTNTRFGSFPHSTLIDLPWGSQVRASKVDTGSRGRRPVESTKRKREDSKDIETPESSKLGKSTAKPVIKKPVVADTGFVHLLPPTPEYWTASLPHRTQVVYTPDYSYVLHRLRVRPGDVLVEAGAGSGSFTHAAARSVFNGYSNLKSRNGHIYSYEFHEQRAEKIRTEIEEHRLQSIVEVNHRDVCEDGFYVCDDMKVTVIFLDLPAPWLALAHLTRSKASDTLKSLNESTTTRSNSCILNQKQTIRLCTFSPCIEQVQRTVAAMRQLGWTDIEMTELSHKRIEIRREKLSLEETRGAHASPSNVEEAVSRLRDVEGRFRSFHEKSIKLKRQDSKAKNQDETRQRKLFKEGNLTHKSESELRTHTSYLVFAVLTQEWSENDERTAQGV